MFGEAIMCLFHTSNAVVKCDFHWLPGLFTRPFQTTSTLAKNPPRRPAVAILERVPILGTETSIIKTLEDLIPMCHVGGSRTEK